MRVEAMFKKASFDLVSLQVTLSEPNTIEQLTTYYNASHNLKNRQSNKNIVENTQYAI